MSREAFFGKSPKERPAINLSRKGRHFDRAARLFPDTVSLCECPGHAKARGKLTSSFAYRTSKLIIHDLAFRGRFLRRFIFYVGEEQQRGFVVRRLIGRILNDDGTDFDRTLRDRLALFLILGLPVLIFFCISDFVVGSNNSSLVVLLTICLQLNSARILRKRGKPVKASRWFMFSICFLFGLIHLWDGQSKSMSLWMISVLPMCAAFLHGTRAAFGYLTIGSIIICMSMAMASVFPIEQKVFATETQCVTLRLASLLFFSVCGLLSRNVTRNQRRLLVTQQAEVKRIKSEHDAAVASKGAFFANVSHEIRTPMNGILGMTQLLISEPLAPKVRDSVAMMHRCAGELLELLNQILDLSSLEMRDRDRSLHVLNLRQTLSTQLAKLQSQNLRISDFDLNGIGENIELKLDRELLARTLFLCLEFASSATKNGHVRIETLSPDHKSIELRVSYLAAAVEYNSKLTTTSHAHHSDSMRTANVSLSIIAQMANLLGAKFGVEYQPELGEEQLTLRFATDFKAHKESDAQLREKARGWLDFKIQRGRAWITTRLDRSNRSEASGILAVIHFLMLSALSGFCLDAFFRGHLLGFTTIICCIVSLLAAAILNLRKKYTDLACWITICAATLEMGLLNLSDGQIKSESLWCLPLIPVGTLFLQGTKAFIGTFFGCILVVASALATTVYFPLEQEWEETFVYLVSVRIVVLWLIGGVCILLAFISQRFARQYRARRSKMLKTLHAAELAHEEKSKFLTNMSHEIRTPMNGILGLAEDLVNQGLPPQQQHAIRTIHRCGGHLLALLGEVFDLSRNEERESVISNISLDLSEVLNDVSYLFQAKAQMKGVTLVTTGADQNLKVMGDPTRLMQVLSNLVGNAIKFSDHGKVELSLTQVTPRTVNGCTGYDITIEVRDQGIGIAQSRLDDLFLSFVQIESSHGPDRGGTGLGLAISKRLVKAMGGELEVESTLGVGSVFRVSLWIANSLMSAQTSLSDPEPSTSRRIPTNDNQNKGERLILVVDDNPINLKVATVSLQRLGYQTRTATDGHEAVALTFDTKFDAILMDVRMPGMDGLEATQVIRSGQGQCKDVPILALTADSYEEQKKLCFQAGMDAHLAKPFRAAELDAELKKLWVA